MQEFCRKTSKNTQKSDIERFTITAITRSNTVDYRESDIESDFLSFFLCCSVLNKLTKIEFNLWEEM